MEEFRNKLQKDIKTYWLLTAVSAVGIIAVVCISFITDGVWNSNSTITAFFAVLLGMSLFYIRRNKTALNDEHLFKHLYIQNSDERNVQIMMKASKTSFIISVLGFSLGSIIFTYINETISSVLSCCMAFIMIVYLSVTFYYNKKM
ncbi:MAG: DUF2178 domain-containing protein [Ruminococcus sp.]|nr:DUF2178 domain-containing protein [Ruminococcus sp.]